ncbi:hypothetical protein [Clostridium thermopalmarium]|uniref:Uncharacterized protein n=1 Tax=Clostridium thermopalmarium DSM 5974 TaxID=1121340 RepID=A0A2T0APJ0_9CLOT|nr:hypothetical protein [Clostridium thermopalmarium]PRR70903.1 hypothetical protein CPAL_19930 [Clostridium thermopalmarium DSM 5974]PVZ28827.1 hypothetical protein LX19_00131 [Clostridium thermopalmarium DSM 5974]
MDMEEGKKEKVREIKRKATIESAGRYFDSLYDKHLEDKRKVKLKLKSKDGNDVIINKTEYEIPFQIDQIILALNGAFEIKVSNFEITRENLSSIEILFE